MSELEFHAGNHTYHYNRIEIPSVSKILGDIDFDNLPDYVVRRIHEAADRGRRTHSYIEAVNKNYTRLEPDPDIKPYIDQYMLFLHGNDYASIQAEAKVCSLDNPHIPEALTSLRYAGTIDDICMLNGKRSIIDYKTSSTIKKRHRLQIGAYMLLTGIDEGYILHLKKDDYKLKKVPVKYKEMFIEKLKEYYEI